MPTDNTCFVIAPIGEADTPVRKRSDQVLKHIIKPAAEACGFTTLRADGIPQPGIITSQIIQQISEAPMLVADLTGRNANVYYELAIRQAIRRPYVQIIDQNEPLPFDVSGVRTIQFNLQDPDSVVDARSEITKQMKSMTGTDGKIESPITAAVDLSTLAKSGNPADRHFVEVLTAIADLKQHVAAFQQQLLAESVLTSGLLKAFSQTIGSDLDSTHLKWFIVADRTRSSNLELLEKAIHDMRIKSDHSITTEEPPKTGE
jgi:hypothetical protein